jgi:hypothetical protein
MGVTIHYRGRLREPAELLPELTQELQLACGRLGWPYRLVDERVVGVAEYSTYHHDSDDVGRVTVETKPLDDRWRGVVIHPPGCETLFLTFNRSGQLIVYDTPWEEPESPGRYQARTHVWVKTQFSDPDTHIAVCSLLRIVEKYAAEWEVEDEGGYWESGDREALAAQMERLNAAMAMLASDEGRKVLEELLGEKIEGEIEIGKRITQPAPLWRRDWGDSAGEN